MNITLRDMRETDIEDYVRWFAKDTAWCLLDTPWEPLDGTEDEEREAWSGYYEMVKDAPEHITRPKFEVEADGKHIGWVCAYDDLEFAQIDDGRAIGIDLPEAAYRGQGCGTEAMRQYMAYLEARGCRFFYAETWSGNTAMLRVLEKLGFSLWHREAGVRLVKGVAHDALTFRREV